MTGAELKAARKAKGLSETELAKRANCHRDTVRYWEAKTVITIAKQNKNGAFFRFCEVLGLLINATPFARARGWALIEAERKTNERALQKALNNADRWAKLAEKNAAKQRQICGAKTRKGTPCKMKSVAGKLRCKFHGGMSTGPRTPEGRERVAEAQRERWRKFREARAA